MTNGSVPKIPPVIIPRRRWREIEDLVRLAVQASAMLERNPKRGGGVVAGSIELLSKKVSAITWRIADDLEDWEKEEEADASEPDSERCVVEVRLSEEDRKAVAELIRRLERLEKSAA